MLDPISAIQNIYGIVQRIRAQVKLVKANEQQCKRLLERVEIIEAAVRGLDQIKDKSHYQAGLNDLLNGLNQCLEFVTKFSTSSRWQRWVLKAGNYKNTFEDLTDMLQKSMMQLNLGFAAQQIVNREEDKQDQAADTNFIKENQALIIDLNCQELKAMQGLHLQQQEQQEVLRLQMAAIQSQLKVIIAKPTPEIKSPKPAIDQKHAIPYYDLVFENLIASGSFGKVYQGKWEGQTVAIKTLEGRLTESEEQQFIREVAIMSRLRHPHITTFFGACLEDNHACIVMEYMEKKSLEHVIKEKPLTLEQQKELSLGIAKGLSYLHNQGILHRDLKSANVLVNAQGVSKLADFGLSKIEANSIQTAREKSQALPWQAPECFDFKGKYTEASDVYSFGVILWEIITSKLPTLSQNQLKDCITVGVRQAIPADAPPALTALIRQCWEVNPAKRPDAKGIIQQLEAYQIRPPSPSAEVYYTNAQAFERQKDFLHAFQDYQKSANKGYCKAKTNLGHFYLTAPNQVVPQDKPKAFECFIEAGNGGHVRAMFNAANMLEYGDGIPQNKGEALLWYRKILKKEPTHTEAIRKCQKLEAALK